MRKTILIAVLAACGFVSAAEVRGVYKLEGERRLILTEKNQAVTREGKEFRHYGSWVVERVEGRERVVVRLRDKDAWQAEMEPKVWLLDILPDGKGLRPRGVGRGTLEAAVKCMEANKNASDQPPVLALIPGAYTDIVAEEVAAAIAAVDAPVRAAAARRRIDDAMGRIKKDLKLLRKIRFVYPKLDPDESVPDAETRHMLYSPEMRMVFDILGDTSIAIDRETLENMLDRVDWKQGDVLAFWILRRDELDADALRKYAPKVLDRIGKTDRYFLRMYFRNPNLPEDIKETARKKGWVDIINTIPLIEKRQDKAPKAE